MIKTLQEARDRFDKLFDQAYEILILGFLSDIEHWDIGNSDKLTLGDNGDLVYNEYEIINNFIDLYRVYPRLFDDNEDFNNLFYEFQKSITRFSLKDLSSLFLADILSRYSKKNTAKLLSVSLEENKEYTTYYIAFQVRVDAKWKNRIIHRMIYKKLDILHSLYENTNSSRV